MSVERQIHDVLDKVRDCELGFEEGLSELKRLVGDLLPEFELFSAVDDAVTRHASVRIIHLELVNQWREAKKKRPSMAGPKKSNGERPSRSKQLASITILAFALSGAPINQYLRGADTMSSPAALFMV